MHIFPQRSSDLSIVNDQAAALEAMTAEKIRMRIVPCECQSPATSCVLKIEQYCSAGNKDFESGETVSFRATNSGVVSRQPGGRQGRDIRWQ
jgi:hypothetical protein